MSISVFLMAVLALMAGLVGAYLLLRRDARQREIEQADLADSLRLPSE